MDIRTEAKRLCGSLGLRSENYEALQIATDFLMNFERRAKMEIIETDRRVAAELPMEEQYKKEHPMAEMVATDEEILSRDQKAKDYADSALGLCK